MPTIVVPNSVTIHTARDFFDRNDFFTPVGPRAELKFHPAWAHLEPLGLSMLAAWGAWCQRNGFEVDACNLTKATDYAWRMKLFEHLRIPYTPSRRLSEHEESGRFMAIRNVRAGSDTSAVIADISALLHLDGHPEGRAAVQYCISELLRNVLEHASSADGAFVCAHNYTKGQAKNRRVSIAVADCGIGVTQHLGRALPDAARSDREALIMALQPGVTGAVPGLYGTPDNAGAGLFITRCIAKGTGGYFLLYSGNSGFRLRRARSDDEMHPLQADPCTERHDLWGFQRRWLGTVVALEIRTDNIIDFESYFGLIRARVPQRLEPRKPVRFT